MNDFNLHALTRYYLYRKLPNAQWEFRIPTVQDVLDWSEHAAERAGWKPNVYGPGHVSIVTAELLKRAE